MVQSALSSYFTVHERARRTTEGRMRSTIPTIVLKLLSMVQTLKKSLENHGKDDEMTLQNRIGDGAKNHLLHGPSRTHYEGDGARRHPRLVYCTENDTEKDRGELAKCHPAVVLNVLIMLHSRWESLENNRGDDRMILQDRAGYGAKDHFLHGPSRSFINNG